MDILSIPTSDPAVELLSLSEPTGDDRPANSRFGQRVSKVEICEKIECWYVEIFYPLHSC